MFDAAGKKICPLCSGVEVIVKYENALYDDRYGYRGFYSLLKCRSCRHGWLDAKFTSGELGKLYTDFYPRSGFKIEDYRPARPVSGFSAWLDGAMRSAFYHVPAGVRVLDIGCGFCDTLGYHAARGCDVYGVEADANAARVAEKYGFKVHIGLFDPRIYEAGFFDYVTLDQVIEHAADPLEMLSGVSRILKPGGAAIISTPNSNGLLAKVFGKKWLHWHAPYHLHHFSRESMAAAAGKCGLELERAITLTPSEWIYYQQLHLFVRPEEGRPAAYWSERGRCGVIAKIALKLLPYFHKTRINHLFTRAVDAAGAGDNFLFFLRKA